MFFSPFGLNLNIKGADEFLFQRIRRKFIYWNSTYLTLFARVVGMNIVLLSLLWYFISIRIMTIDVIKRLRAKI